MSELLIELLSEEIPARMQTRAADDLKSLLSERLTAAGLVFTHARAYATPRRLALVVEGLPGRSPDVKEERKGPREGAPQQAIDGFLKANGLADLSGCDLREAGKAKFWFLTIDRPGQPTAALLPALVAEAIAAFPWPKSMRWGRGTKSWVRPLHRLLCVFGGEVLPVTLDFGGGVTISAGNQTEGHRFLGRGPFAVTSFADYQAKLAAAHVLLDAEARKAAILERLQALASAEGLTLKPDAGLLEEVAGLVEWPVPLIGRIDDSFMDVPPEVLTTSMRTHQKYFALTRQDGSLAPRFAVVANMEAADKGAAITAGNERVLRARLADARFFWDSDRAIALQERLPALQGVVFHAKLGTLRQKVERMERLAAWLAKYIPGCDPDMARGAAHLAKADLASGMVGEFPELQGLMGRYYALLQGVPEPVADAIAAHYRPQGPGDACPTEPVSIAVALADKLDTLVGFFAVDERPTGSKDPFALRRATLGIIRLIVENGLRLPLREAVTEALNAYLDFEHGEVQTRLHAKHALLTGGMPVREALKVANDLFSAEFLRDYFADRFKVGLKEKGVRHDLIAAVFALDKPGGGPEDDGVRLLAKVAALGSFLASEDGANLLTAYRRAVNILKIEEKKDGRAHAGAPDPRLLEAAEEKALAAALDAAQGEVAAALESEDYGRAMAAMARLRAPVDAFFDRVTVNADDAALRENRLKLLARIRATLGQVADFGQVEG